MWFEALKTTIKFGLVLKCICQAAVLKVMNEP